MTSDRSPDKVLASLRRTKEILFASIAAGFLTVTTVSTPATATTVPAATTPAPVVLILLENHSRSAISAKAAPYLTDFANAGRTFRRYKAIEHPSLPNYLDIVSGGNQGCTTDSCPRQTFAANNVFHQVGTWQSWEESMPSDCGLNSSSPYAVKHNPAAYFTDLDSTCSTHDIPYPTTLPTTMPAFTFITPNLNDDMHDGTVAKGDAWCKAHIPALLAKGAIVIVTFDEGSNSQTVYTAMQGPGIDQGVNRDTFNHYSLLAGLEDHFAVSRLGHAVGITPLPI
ncbi:MAG: alkaline phosphatase family protein [Actinomycetota bacterium]|nr:alkaline phosphatase family protein [Actinomycetota bacterium]